MSTPPLSPNRPPSTVPHTIVSTPVVQATSTEEVIRAFLLSAQPMPFPSETDSEHPLSSRVNLLDSPSSTEPYSFTQDFSSEFFRAFPRVSPSDYPNVSTPIDQAASAEEANRAHSTAPRALFQYSSSDPLLDMSTPPAQAPHPLAHAISIPDDLLLPNRSPMMITVEFFDQERRFQREEERRGYQEAYCAHFTEAPPLPFPSETDSEYPFSSRESHLDSLLNTELSREIAESDQSFTPTQSRSPST